MAYSPSIKILDHLNLVSSKSIYFWSRPMHFQLMSSGPTIDIVLLRRGGEAQFYSSTTMAGYEKSDRQRSPKSIKWDPEGPHKEGREVLEMHKGLA